MRYPRIISLSPILRRWVLRVLLGATATPTCQHLTGSRTRALCFVMLCFQAGSDVWPRTRVGFRTHIRYSRRRLPSALGHRRHRGVTVDASAASSNGSLRRTVRFFERNRTRAKFSSFTRAFSAESILRAPASGASPAAADATHPLLSGVTVDAPAAALNGESPSSAPFRRTRSHGPRPRERLQQQRSPLTLSSPE